MSGARAQPARAGWPSRLARALFKWILGFEGTLLIALIVATAVVGAVVCVAGELGGEQR